MILRDRELFMSRRFVLKAAAAQWAEVQRVDLQK
jgi:hypothetical protein